MGSDGGLCPAACHPPSPGQKWFPRALKTLCVPPGQGQDRGPCATPLQRGGPADTVGGASSCPLSALEQQGWQGGCGARGPHPSSVVPAWGTLGVPAALRGPSRRRGWAGGAGRDSWGHLPYIPALGKCPWHGLGTLQDIPRTPLGHSRGQRQGQSLTAPESWCPRGWGQGLTLCHVPPRSGQAEGSAGDAAPVSVTQR